MSHQRVVSLLQLGRHAEAEALARESLATRPDDAFMQVLLARTLFRQDKVGPAADIIDAAIAQNPEFAYAYRVRGTIHMATGFHSEADKSLTHSIALDPDDELSYLQRAHLDIGRMRARPKRLQNFAKKSKFSPDLDRAFADLNTALALAPERAEIHLGFASLFIVQRRLVDAEHAAKRALELDPESAAAHETLGILAEERNDVRAASEHYVAAGRADPTESRPLDRLKKLGAPALAVPGIIAYVAIRLAIDGARVSTATFVIVAVAAIVGLVAWAAHSRSKLVAARNALDPTARQIIETDRANRRRRFGR